MRHQLSEAPTVLLAGRDAACVEIATQRTSARIGTLRKYAHMFPSLICHDREAEELDATAKSKNRLRPLGHDSDIS